MVRKGLLVALAGLLLASVANAQAPTSAFRWQAGTLLTYRVEQQMAASEVVAGTKVESKTKLNLVKRWQVQAVDQAGVATVQLSLAAMRMETTTPSGEVLLYDSSAPDKSTPQLREQMAAYVGTPLAVLRLDSRGKVIEVKESKHGPSTKYESEPPFAVTLPDVPLSGGKAWDRPYTITLAPPQGTGEKYEAVQNYVCKEIKGGLAAIELKTTLKTLPEAVADQAPLLQLQPDGEIVFNLEAGRLESVQLRIDKELKGHQGEGSSYRFQSLYTEQYVSNN